MRPALVPVLLVVCSCAPPPPSHSELRQVETGIPEITPAAAHEPGWIPVGHVVGESCRASNFEPLPSERTARFQLRQRAFAMRATAVVAVRCRTTDFLREGCEGWRCDAEGVMRAEQ